MPTTPDRIDLATLPTPLERADRLSAAWGGPTIWVKRDDLTGFGLSGNKVRKLEYHFAAAIASGADTVVTCGAVQSNHCRATAVAAARLGLACDVYLRAAAPPRSVTANHLLMRLAGASVTLVTPDEYSARDKLMEARAAEYAAAGRSAWVIPEGASDALGMWGLVRGTRELADQAAVILARRISIWHAASSGGTTAGIAWAIDRLGLDMDVTAVSVGDSGDEFGSRLSAIWSTATAGWGGATPGVPIDFVDGYVGGGYGVASTEQLAVEAEATALTGLLFDPTYTGKALFALKSEIEAGRFGRDDHVVFWHTGGGFAVFATDYGGVI